MRPKDEKGRALPAPHARLPQDELERLSAAGFFALATDSRSAIWTSKRKLAILDEVIDRVVDGDSIPKWICRPDGGRLENKALVELWRLAEGAVRGAWHVKAAQ